MATASHWYRHLLLSFYLLAGIVTGVIRGGCRAKGFLAASRLVNSWIQPTDSALRVACVSACPNCARARALVGVRAFCRFIVTNLRSLFLFFACEWLQRQQVIAPAEYANI